VDKISTDDLGNSSLYKICMQKQNINKNMLNCKCSCIFI